MAATLVTLTDAKTRLGITHNEADALYEQELEEAEALILDYLKFGEPSPFVPEIPWDPTTVPPQIRASILHTFVDLDWNRGETHQPERTFPSEIVKGMLVRWRDPAYA
jgi:Phage gp6-like head-tail connector protein